MGHGGAQDYLCNLLRCCQRMGGIENEVIALFFKGPLWERIKGIGIPATCLNLRGALDIFRIVRLCCCLRLSKHDIIHVHHFNPIANAIICVLAKNNVFTEHGGALLSGDWKPKLIYWIFYRKYCRIIAISKAMAKVMGEVNSRAIRRINVVYNGTDIMGVDSMPSHRGCGLPRRFNNSRYRVGIVGRLVQQKGHSTFLDTAARLARIRDDIAFPIVGDGPLRKDLEAKAKYLNLTQNVLFLGYRSDAISILKRFDVYLFTSYQEGFGLVLVEAMAAGVPIVALDQQGAVREIIENGVDGIVVDRKDPNLLAEQVVRLIEDSSLRKRLILNARQKVEKRFSIEKNASEVFGIYSECLGKK